MNQSEAKRKALSEILEFAKQIKKDKVASKLRRPEKKEEEAGNDGIESPSGH